jgi:protein-tyrosine phosphatase
MGFFQKIFGKTEETLQFNDYSSVGFDMHSHFIFGVDDGAQTLEESMFLIKALMNFGYKKICTTPHIMGDFYKNSPETILPKLQIINDELKKQNIDFEITAAAEYYCDYEFLQRIEKEPLMCVIGKYVLFELSYLNAPEMLNEVVFALKANGYKPVMAHPERYPYYFANFDTYKSIYEKGVLLQLNINSLTGQYGPATVKIAEKLIDNNLISFLGSDCHHSGHINLMKHSIKNKHMQKLMASGMLYNSTFL